MAATNIRGGQILDAGVTRADLNVDTSGSAVVTKALAGTNISETSHTGADVGTGDVTIALSANPSVTSITTTAADYTNTIILKSSTTDSTRSTNIKFEDNLTAGATKLYLRKDGDALVLLTNAGTTRHKFSSETGTSNYLSGNTRIGDLTSPNAVLDVLTDGIIPTLYGSNSASGTLTLGSTKDATKGKILFGTSAYDEVNNRLGIGTASPSYGLEVTTIGYFGVTGATTAPFQVIGGASGTDLVRLIRTTGATLTYGWSLAGGKLSFTSVTNSKTTLQTSWNAIGGSRAEINVGFDYGASTDSPGDPGLLKGSDAGGGGADDAGGDLYIAPGRGRGAATPAKLYIQTTTALASGTTQQSLTTRVTVDHQYVTSTLPIVQDDIVRPYITVGGTTTSRTFTVSIEKFNNSAGANTRFLLHWWVSATSYGTPSDPGAGTTFAIVVSTGTNFGAESFTALNTAYTDSNGDLVVTVTSAETGAGANYYFHVEVQGIIYQAVGTVLTEAIP